MWRSDDIDGLDLGAAADWYFREALLRLPQSRPDRRIFVVGAPPGSGRSLLVRRWLQRQPDVAWTWVALGGPVSPGVDLLEDVVGPAIRRQSAEGLGGFVVLDGVEALKPEELAQVIGLGGVRLVLVGRGEVLPGAVAVRLAGELVEVRGDDLWWPVDVVQAQLAALNGARISTAWAERIHRVSGGWPSGVLALGRTQSSATDLDELARLAGSLVLDRIPSDLKTFVLETSTVPHLTQDLDLCADLVPGLNPATMLEEARRWGLTADQWPIRTPGEAAHYHPFVAAAAQRICAEQVGRPSDNLRRVAEKASGLGRDVLAVDCFMAAKAWLQALEELERSAKKGFSGWEMSHLQATITVLPESAWEDRSDHRALIALAAAVCGDHLFAAELMARPSSAAWWGAARTLIQAWSAPVAPDAWESELPEVFAIRDQGALEAVFHVLNARVGVFEGRSGSVSRHLSAAWRTGADRMPGYIVMAGLGTESLNAAWAGELFAAQRLAERARALAEQAGMAGHPMLAAAVLAEAEVLRARDEPAAALHLLDRDAVIVGAGEEFVTSVHGGAASGQARRILRARLLLDLNDVPQARAELAQVNDHLPTALAVRRALARARLAELEGDHAGAQAGLAGAPNVPNIAAARLYLALQRQDEEQAAAILALWPSDTGLEDRLRRLLAEAAVALAAGHRGPASDLSNDALVAAEPDGHLSIFLEVPAPLRVLVSTMLRRSPDASQWRRALTAGLDRAGAFPDEGAGVTRREVVVLEKLTTDLTHAQIAAELFVSDNTLKSHCRNLYRKLGVHSREEAVRIARVRGWLNASSAERKVVDVNIPRTPDVVDVAEL
ncbi:hypothetical protein GCM10027456_12780 [Kineosporia babensis]